MYNSYGLDMDQIEFIEDVIQGIYSLELIFQDFKLHELNINWNDTKFIIPYFNSLNEKLELLNSISGKIGSRLHSLIISEAIKTLKDNSQNKFDDLGGFIFAIYKNLDLMYSDDILSQLDKARLLLLATYINYNDNKLVYPNGKSITRSHLSGLLRISEDRVRIFMNKMKELELITISDSRELYISKDLFFKGSANKQLYSNDYIGYTRIFINTYQYLYDTMDKRKLKYLGIIYNMLGYINFYHNVLCLEGITESDYTKLKVMTLNELYVLCTNKTDATSQAIGKFKRGLAGIKLDNDQPLFAFVKTDDVDKILINPYVTYKSSNIDTFTETLKVIFENNTSDKSKKIKRGKK